MFYKSCAALFLSCVLEWRHAMKHVAKQPTALWLLLWPSFWSIDLVSDLLFQRAITCIRLALSMWCDLDWLYFTVCLYVHSITYLLVFIGGFNQRHCLPKYFWLWSLWSGQNYRLMTFSYNQFILRKIIEIVATWCQILRLKRHQIRFRLGLRPRPR